MKELILLMMLIFVPGIIFASAPMSEVDRSLDMVGAQSWEAMMEDQGGKVLVRQVIIDGFLLREKKKLAPVFKHYRNKRLTLEEIKGIVAAVNALYTEAGYEKLVDFYYKVDKKGRLVIHASLKE